jgi:hypothetical protein
MGCAAMINRFEHVLIYRLVIDPEAQLQFDLRARSHSGRLSILDWKRSHQGLSSGSVSRVHPPRRQRRGRESDVPVPSPPNGS